MNKYLKETKMLDYSNPNIQQLIENRKWLELQEFDRLKSIYNFVRDEILFGYNIDDNIPASKVLKDGFGQCNTRVLCLWLCSEPATFLVGYTDLRLTKNFKRVQ